MNSRIIPPPNGRVIPPPIRFEKLHDDAVTPKRMTEGSIGLDVFAYLISATGRAMKLVLPPYNTRLVPTGLLIEPPTGHFVQVCARSSLAAKSIIVANGPGIIDPDYRGELKVLLYNGSWETQWIEHEQRIAQLVVMPAVLTGAVIVQKLSEAPSRGAAGFGSTGR